jgi:hypothetical protein
VKRLAQGTTELYDELIRCKTPPEIAHGYFIINHLRQRGAFLAAPDSIGAIIGPG